MKALALIFVLVFASPALAQVNVGDVAPEIEFTNTWNGDGKTKLSEFLGEFVLLEFAVTW